VDAVTLNFGLTAGFIDAESRLLRFGGRLDGFLRDPNTPFGRGCGCVGGVRNPTPEPDPDSSNYNKFMNE